MKSGPEKRQIVDSAVAVSACAPAPTNPALDELASAYEAQSRSLQAALSLARSRGELQVAVRSELLQAIDEACTVLVISSTRFPSVNRC
jgi:hypothetical protein